MRQVNLLIFLFVVFAYSGLAQKSLFGISPPSSSMFKLVSTPMGQPLPASPSRNSERIKIKSLITRDSSSYIVYTKEFVGNKHVPDYYELTQMALLMKDTNFVWEIVPDTSDLHHFRVFTYFPGAMSHRERFTDQDKYFNYKMFKYSNKAVYGEEIPLMIIYEDDLKTKKTEQLINHFLKGDSIIDVAKKEFPYSEINRYILIYYVMNCLN